MPHNTTKKVKSPTKVGRGKGEKKGNFISNIISVYQSPGDCEAKIPPLFNFQVDFSEVDMERLKHIPNAKIFYEIKIT